MSPTDGSLDPLPRLLLTKSEHSIGSMSMLWCERCMRPMVWGSPEYRLAGCSRWSLLTHICRPEDRRTHWFFLIPASWKRSVARTVSKGAYQSLVSRLPFRVRSRLWFKVLILKARSAPSRLMAMARRFGSTKPTTFKVKRSCLTLPGSVKIFIFESWQSS